MQSGMCHAIPPAFTPNWMMKMKHILSLFQILLDPEKDTLFEITEEKPPLISGAEIIGLDDFSKCCLFLYFLIYSGTCYIMLDGSTYKVGGKVIYFYWSIIDRLEAK